jgi:predicted enzyme related to lactoylglutathione lyase
MNATGFVFNINSPQPDALRDFYRDVIGLKPNPPMGEGALLAGGTPFLIDSHSDITGPTIEPARTIMNFQVDDVAAGKVRLESKGVRFISEPSDEPISFATFVDPDGNYGQIFSMQGAPAGGDGFAVMRTSADADRLRAFYRDVVGLNDDHPQLGNPFIIDTTSVYVGPHSDLSGPAREPARVLLNVFVDDLAAEQKRMEAAGARFIRSAGKEYWGGVISTFVDPDGAYSQLIEFKPQA